MAEKDIPVKIIYIKNNIQIVFNLFFKKGDSIKFLFFKYSKILQKYINIKGNISIGVFGIKKEPEYIIKYGDRIEIYQDLLYKAH